MNREGWGELADDLAAVTGPEPTSGGFGEVLEDMRDDEDGPESP